MAAGSFTFLAVDGTGRPSDPGSRAAIRSQCMKGVNVRKDSRRSKRKAKTRKVDSQETVQTTTNDAIIMRRRDSSLYRISSLQNYSLDSRLFKPLSMSIADLGFDSSLFPSSVMQTVMKYNSILETVYPLMSVNVQTITIDDFQLLQQSRTLLNAVYLATHAVEDLRRHRRLSSWTQQLLCVILSSLNQDLHQPTSRQSSATMITILILMLAAEYLQDFAAVGSHLEGIKRLLMIKGNAVTGLDVKLLFKIQQVDLRLSLASGRPLYLALEPNGYPTLAMSPITAPKILQKFGIYSPRVVEALQNLQALTQDVKYAMKARTDLMWANFQSQINDIQAQLLQPNSDYAGVDEALRLGILGFLTTLSRSPIQRHRLPDFEKQLKTIYTTMQGQNETFTIWIMMMGFLSAVDVSDPLVGDLWDANVDSDLSWETGRNMILAEDLPWIELIHDRPAKKAFVYLQAQRTLR